VDEEIEIIEICKQFGWTYEEYLNTPLWFLVAVKARNKTEAYFIDRENKKVRRAGKFT